MAKVIEIEFAGVDRFNRPTFVSKKAIPFKTIYDGQTKIHVYFCDTEHLFDYNATEEVIDAYRADPDKVKSIIYKGTRFGAEPSGEHVNVKIVGLQHEINAEMTARELLRRHKATLKASNQLVIALQSLGAAASELYGVKLIAAISGGEEIEFRRVDEFGIANDYDRILIEDILNKSKAI